VEAGSVGGQHPAEDRPTPATVVSALLSAQTILRRAEESLRNAIAAAAELVQKSHICTLSRCFLLQGATSEAAKGSRSQRSR